MLFCWRVYVFHRPPSTYITFFLTTLCLATSTGFPGQKKRSRWNLPRHREPELKVEGMETYSNSLLIALAQARRAVELDTIGTDPQAAIDAYKRSITVLKGAITMMETRETLTGAGDKEKAYELQKLGEIHDKYLDRIQTLCDVLGLPLPA